MKIVVINGSHRKNGNCYQFTRQAVDILSTKHSVQSFDLIDCRIEKCNGCLICEDGENCPIKDDYSNAIQPALKEADLIIFATPTYFNMPSSSLVNLFDRTNDMCEFFADNTKKAWAFLVGQTDEESVMDAYKCIKTYLDIMCIEMIGEPGIEIARMPQAVDESVISFLKSI